MVWLQGDDTQVLKSGAGVPTQVPERHEAPTPQTWPQAPQLDRSCRLASQPLTSEPSQSAKPATHWQPAVVHDVVFGSVPAAPPVGSPWKSAETELRPLGRNTSGT